MALKNPFKLEKLCISVYSDVERKIAVDTFEAMFNPTSFSMSHSNVFQDVQGLNTSGRQQRYTHSTPGDLSLDFVIDGTGVTDYGLTQLLGMGADSVSTQIDNFLDLCFHMDGELHQPKFLKIQWGEGQLKGFNCRLKNVDIKQTLFDKNGACLRAELKTIFVEDIEETTRLKKEGKSSPDLTHERTIKSGDTLLLMCKEIYGTPVHYLMVARENNLDNFRDLTPGQTIYFPPLDGVKNA
ncbi:MAG: LysM peptidoglycan-binding domain-containing protein [Pseudomonadales bacterium]|nr:LysM peptidoglycan-binding domain-containing protein [Pseudomonadales bacterium]